MTKQEIVNRLLALPAEITKAEQVLMASDRQVLGAKDILQEREDSLLLGTAIDGKNAEIRAAQMRKFTEHERSDLLKAERDVKNAAVRLGALRDEFKALQAVASLLKEDVA